MNPRLLGLSILAVTVVYVATESYKPPNPPPRPVVPSGPVTPTPQPPPAPRPPRGPWGTGTASVEARVGGRTSPDGAEELNCDLPGALHRRNVTSQGQGCCVFTSLHHASWFQNAPALRDFPAWLQSHHLAGGGYSSNVAARITAICRERGVPEPPYVQVENSRDMAILQLASRTGRMICSTYSRSPTGRYSGSSIAHMVNLPHVSPQWIAVLDNNYIGDTNYEWMTPDEFLRISNPRGYWAVILLTPPPPPPPRN